MSYFEENGDCFVIRPSSGPNAGLRPGQIAALYATAAHFTSSDEGAIVSLPTGYGKSAVLVGLCFLLRPKRVLVVVPTASLRKQMGKTFSDLDVLKRLDLLANRDLRPPTVALLESRPANREAWVALEGADVVIATPQVVSPENDGVSPPPEGFFDLVLVDEGHHSPAATWAALLSHVNANQVLVSATPFRRDRLGLPGKLIFHYPLRKAAAEGAFGKVTFDAIDTPEGADRPEIDELLATKAEAIYRRDRDAGFDHRMLIRTNTVAHAKDLVNLYVAKGLRVEAVSSMVSRRQIDKIEQRLASNDIDGVVCVDMFGEGYDFPKFKIAVLHAVHRSLVPTLQFIGRFARTNDLKTADATFIAPFSHVQSESGELFREGVDWSVLLADVADAQQAKAAVEREFTEGFDSTDTGSVVDLLTLDNVRCHFTQRSSGHLWSLT
ncbi:DEAD/DEAH box helicase [Luteibacter yeojuensis]|uniref:DEAD/DEAH box helicase n=1 Tax=Luteibacter yeojuensis TaxID=345309 RepID=UPI0009FBF720|nr:DEAD/DEAH box helicase family protein [Luteibacter yeojuensis]